MFGFCAPCGRFNNRVTTLSRSHQKLRTIPQEILKMKHLTEIDLEYNDIMFIPETFFTLVNLERIFLSENQIAGISKSISQLKNLTELDLSHNNVFSLPANLGQCDNLRTLKLSYTLIERFPFCLTQLNNLTNLDVSFTSVQQLPEQIGLMTGLIALELRNTYITQLPDSIGQLVNLELLDCGSIASLVELTSSIGDCCRLQTLLLERTGLKSLPLSIGRLKELQTLDVSESTLESIPSSIGDLECLTELILICNKISTLPDSIGKLKHLVCLKAEENILNSLPQTIGNCTELTELYASNNKISEIPPSLGLLTKLSTLGLGRNKIKSIPPELFNAANLSFVYLCDNEIKFVPENIGNLTKLSVLDLSGNQLKYLPITLNLCPLKLIRLSDSQSRSMIVFQKGFEEDKQVLTSIYLPQGHYKNHETDKCVVIQSAQVPMFHMPSCTLNNPFKRSESVKMGVSFDDTDDRKILSVDDIQIEIKVHCQPNEGLGMSIGGGINSVPYINDDRGIFVVELFTNSSASKSGIRIGDKLIKVNGHHMTGLGHEQAVDVLRSCNGNYDFVISRKTEFSDTGSSPTLSNLPSVIKSLGLTSQYPLKKVELSRGVNSKFGVTIHGGVNVNALPFSLTDGGPFIARVSNNNCGLRVGHRILAADGINVTKLTNKDIESYFHSRNSVSLIVSEDPIPSGYMSITIKKSFSEKVGMTLRKEGPAIYVKDIHREGAVGRDGTVKEGSMLMTIDDSFFFDISLDEAERIVNSLKGDFVISFCDPPVSDKVNYSVIKPVKPTVPVQNAGNVQMKNISDILPPNKSMPGGNLRKFNEKTKQNGNDLNNRLVDNIKMSNDKNTSVNSAQSDSSFYSSLNKSFPDFNVYKNRQQTPISFVPKSKRDFSDSSQSLTANKTPMKYADVMLSTNSPYKVDFHSSPMVERPEGRVTAASSTQTPPDYANISNNSSNSRIRLLLPNDYENINRLNKRLLGSNDSKGGSTDDGERQ